LSTRVDILTQAQNFTSDNRDAEYGDPKVNLACAGELKAVLRKWAQRGKRVIGPGEQEAIDLVVTKLGRVITGKPGRDTYVDGACYFAIAGECAEHEQQHFEDNGERKDVDRLKELEDALAMKPAAGHLLRRVLPEVPPLESGGK
jgi:hypothetical protein